MSVGFQFRPTNLSGCFRLTVPGGSDSRGNFIKLLHRSSFEKQLGFSLSAAEVFVSTSHKDVIRGMHFQTPPHDHFKIVTCLTGAVLDVVVDLRKGSPTEGQHEAFHLDNPREALFIPRGFAHGFLSLRDNSTMLYVVETEHAPAHDTGILYSSFGYQWPTSVPIVSDRDKGFGRLEELKSPFIYSPTK